MFRKKKDFFIFHDDYYSPSFSDCVKFIYEIDEYPMDDSERIKYKLEEHNSNHLNEKKCHFINYRDLDYYAPPKETAMISLLFLLDQWCYYPRNAFLTDTVFKDLVQLFKKYKSRKHEITEESYKIPQGLFIRNGPYTNRIDVEYVLDDYDDIMEDAHRSLENDWSRGKRPRKQTINYEDLWETINPKDAAMIQLLFLLRRTHPFDDDEGMEITEFRFDDIEKIMNEYIEKTEEII